MIEIIEGDCADYIDLARDCDAMLTDPPYGSWVHDKATSHSTRANQAQSIRSKRDLGFASIDEGGTRETLARYVSRVRMWSAVFSDTESVGANSAACKAHGAKYIRGVAWIRWSMPQLSGDRPPQGCEIVSLFRGAKPHGRLVYNGPGNLTHWAWAALRGDKNTKHPTEKPLPLILDQVSWFTMPGDTVIDPFAGGGTTAVACKVLGRDCIAVERDPSHVDRIEARTRGALLDRDVLQVRRWLDGSEPGPSDNATKLLHRIDDFERAMFAIKAK